MLAVKIYTVFKKPYNKRTEQAYVSRVACYAKEKHFA